MFIQIAACTLVLTSVAGGIWSVRATVSVSVPELKVSSVRAETAESELSKQPSHAETWQRLFSRRLQQPLFDPPPKVAIVEEKKPAPPPPIQIIATMPEAGGGHAMVQDANGRVIVLSVGGVITTNNSEAKLSSVFNDRVELEYEGETITLKLKAD
jgi:hypothetical protein